MYLLKIQPVFSILPHLLRNRGLEIPVSPFREYGRIFFCFRIEFLCSSKGFLPVSLPAGTCAKAPATARRQGGKNSVSFLCFTSSRQQIKVDFGNESYSQKPINLKNIFSSPQKLYSEVPAKGSPQVQLLKEYRRVLRKRSVGCRPVWCI